ncbi:hypothetical protein MKK70_21395 [Methylobacterium sp. E-041]|uniref:hypothetical protein n=1 Tax=Methylobacterium sp. E-041 TaxID=2836573 RepID=UPI001FBAF420|nr:hypothetical protein [Methylobacterium sp. E-041]MCJ2107884.1 hypothetical protein [Methylobacterium sp. E-041]
MSNADISRAQSFTDELLRWEIRGPGDTANAMRRIATRSALPFAKLWALRYRPPKEIASHVLARIEAAHAAELQRQLRKLAHDVQVTAAVAGPAHRAVRAGEALLRAADGGPEGAGAGVADADLGSNRRPDRKRDPGLNDLPLWRALNEGE